MGNVCLPGKQARDYRSLGALGSSCTRSRTVPVFALDGKSRRSMVGEPGSLMMQLLDATCVLVTDDRNR